MESRINLMANDLGAELGKRFAAVSLLIQQSSLPRPTQELVMLRASQINGCRFCTDLHTREATAAGESAVRLRLLPTWRESTLFTEPERAALALTEEGTRLPDTHQGVSDRTWTKIREYYDEAQTTALIYLIAMINAANRLGVISRPPTASRRPTMPAN